MSLHVTLDGVRAQMLAGWGKAAFVLRASEGAPSMPAPRVWSLVASACQLRRDRDARAPSMRFWVERSEPVDIEAFLPGRDDAGVAPYLDRLRARIGERDFTLVVNGAQALARDVYLELRAFLAPVTATAGIAVAETAIYLSRSRRTVFGVHCDESSNFLLVAYGTKRFRLWPREVLDAHPHLKHAIAYGEIMDRSTLVHLEAGDLLYMPSGCYHVAESEGEVGLHFSVGVRHDPDLARSMVERAASRAISDRLRGVPSAAFLPSEDGTREVRLPTPLAQGVAALSGDFAADAERALVEQWATLASAGGFTRVPAAATEPAVLADDAGVRLVGAFPILFATHGDELLLAAHGHALRVPAHPGIVRLVERLNDGRAWPVGLLLAEHSGEVVVDGVSFEADAEGLRELLRSLVAIGALSAEPTPAPRTHAAHDHPQAR